MADDTEGYDCEWVKDPPDSLKCLICLLVVREPQQHGHCGRLFCNSCITKYKEKKRIRTCPYCRRVLTTFSDGKSAREVKSLEVKCNNMECTWEGELRSLPQHIDICEYTLVDCPNVCDIETLMRRDLEAHLKSECLYRDYTCPYCEEEGEYCEITTSHLEKCHEMEIKCPNEGCDEYFPRCELEEHTLYSCDYQLVACSYAEFGCEVRPLRKDRKKHEEDSQLHLQMTMEKVLDMNRDITLLRNLVYLKEKQIERLEQKLHHDSLFKFKICKFRRMKEHQSPPFYAFRDGYKMCVTVYNFKGASTHVAVFVHLMKGDYDDSLTWPFTGTVIIELLNQQMDENHHKMPITFPADAEYSRRVVNGKRGVGLGYPEFISHSELGY